MVEMYSKNPFFFSEIFPRDLNLKDKFIKHFTGKHTIYQ